MRQIFVSLSFMTLSACAVLGLTPSNDPDIKIRDAIQGLEQGRAPRAKQLANEALSLYEQQKKPFGQARAQSVLGDIHQNGKGKGFPDLEQAKIHYLAAAKIYGEAGQPKWQALNLQAVASVDHLQNRSGDACETLAQAKKAYSKAPAPTRATEEFEKAGAFSYYSFAELEGRFKCRDLRKDTK